jgi:beta-mannosidase
VNASLDYFGQLPHDSKLNYVLKDADNSTILQGFLNDVNCTDGSITGSTIVPSDTVEL